MTIPVQCPACSKEYGLRDELAGKRVRCKDCGEEISVPLLRKVADNEADQSRPTSTKATPMKLSSASTKGTSPASKLAKEKPAAKPKPARRNNNDDDLFEDDFGDAEADADEVVEFDDDRTRSERPRKRTTKKSPKKDSVTGPGAAGIVRGIVAFVSDNVIGFPLTFLVCGWIATRILLANGVNQQAWGALPGSVVGGSLLFIALLWLVSDAFRGAGRDSPWIWGLVGVNILRVLSGRHPAIDLIWLLLVTAGAIGYLITSWDKAWKPCFVFGIGILFINSSSIPGLEFLAGGNPPAVVAPQPVAGPNGNLLPNVPAPAGGEVNSTGVTSQSAEVAPFPIADVQIPELPEFSLGQGGHGETSPVPEITCMRHFFHNAKGNMALASQIPGTNMTLIYYEPKGSHSPRSLPCVLVASAGSNLLQGTECPSKEYVNETIPYVQAGFAVLGISVDGYVIASVGSPESQLQLSFAQFQKAQAGIVNVRNAVEFVSKKIPQVDPERIFIAGHSSAATLALLAVEHEPRLKGCVAYAPITDVEARLRDGLNQPGIDRLLPGVRQFAKQSSPLSHFKRINSPVFLFHATDDSNAPVSDSRRFADLLKANGKQIDYVEVPTGNHYDSMIQQGIPRAILWLKQLASAGGANAAPAVAQNQSTPKQNAGVTSVPALPQFPFTSLPQNSNAARQPSGRMVTFRFQSFGGQGDATAAARRALQNVTWADPNDIEIDSAKGEVRIGQLGGSVNTDSALQTLKMAGFQMLPGVSIGSKSSPASATETPKNEASKPATAALKETPETPNKNPPITNPPAKLEVSKPKPAVAPSVSNPSEKRPQRETARRVVTFRYERFTGKGSSANALKEALKRIDWADQEDIVMIAAKKEIRIGLLAESPNYEQARKALTNQGFLMSVGETISTTKD